MILAHVFLAPYTLPVPFWMYLYGCAATLILSFALLALFATRSSTARGSTAAVIPSTGTTPAFWRVVVACLRAGAVAALALTIAAGFVGARDPNSNAGMTIFWVGFLLAFTYAVAVVGDIYLWINPWHTLGTALKALGVDVDLARVRYPSALAYWPAVAGYVALVWIELFALPRPSTLGTALTVYTSLMLVGMAVFGRAQWLQHADLFAVLFRVVGSLAPVEYHSVPGQSGPRARLRAPLSGAIDADAGHVSLVVFILFMLASTTFDTVHQTYLWVSLYWQRLLPMLRPLWGGDMVAAQAALTRGYWWYQWLGLILSPLFYLALFLAVMTVARVTSRTLVPRWALVRRFAFSLVPIAVAYHATHYAPSMVTQLPSLLPQLADPFYRGWHLFPVAAPSVTVLPMSVIWHAQVFVLLAGHIAAVYVAHTVSLRVFPSRGQGVASQLPMLALMVAYTFLGLWALSLPLGVPQIVPIAG